MIPQKYCLYHKTFNYVIYRYTIGLPYFNLRTMVQPQIRTAPDQLESNANIPSVRLPRDELPTVIEVYGNG